MSKSNVAIIMGWSRFRKNCVDKLRLELSNLLGGSIWYFKSDDLLWLNYEELTSEFCVQDWQKMRGTLKFRIEIQYIWRAVLLDFLKACVFFHQSVLGVGIPVLKMTVFWKDSMQEETENCFISYNYTTGISSFFMWKIVRANLLKAYWLSDFVFKLNDWLNLSCRWEWNVERIPKCPLLSPGGVKSKMRGIVGINNLIKTE